MADPEHLNWSLSVTRSVLRSLLRGELLIRPSGVPDDDVDAIMSHVKEQEIHARGDHYLWLLDETGGLVACWNRYAGKPHLSDIEGADMRYDTEMAQQALEKLIRKRKRIWRQLEETIDTVPHLVGLIANALLANERGGNPSPVYMCVANLYVALNTFEHTIAQHKLKWLKHTEKGALRGGW